VKKLLQYELMINPALADFVVHLTTDYSDVAAGTTQRFPGWHTDGFQGAKFPTKLVCEHSYVLASSPGFEVCVQPFFIEHLDASLYNMFKVFDQQARAANVFSALPNHVYLIDPYVVHRTPLIREKTSRAFFRLTIANNALPIEYNTLNPMLKEVKHHEKLDIRDFIQAPDIPIDLARYGLGAKLQLTTTGSRPHQDVGEFPEPTLTPGETLVITKMRFPIVRPSSPTYKDITEPFSLLKYTNPRLPINLGKVDVTQIEKCPNVLRLPIKYAGTDDALIPEELASIRPLLTRLLNYEANINPNYEDMYAHVTIDARQVTPGHTQRFPGFHGDDLQGGIFAQKLLTAHSYILTTSPPTEVCLQPFFVAHLDDSFEKVFDAFDQQADLSNVYSLLSGHIYLTDPYSVHRTPLLSDPTARVFFRLTISPPGLLLPHNSVNPMFADRPYPGDTAIHTDESRFLVPPDRPIPYEYYGLQSPPPPR
jgi:hypothetical protein